MILEQLKHLYFRMPLIVRLLVTILLIMLLFGALIHIVEPDTFPSVFDGVWWAFVTGATVGFGDFVPLTITGKIIGILLILSGGGMITFYITTFSATTVRHKQNLSEGKVAFKGQNHSIYIGWNERTRKLIDMVLKRKDDEQIVIIDRSMEKIPFSAEPVHFIQGNPSEDRILDMANVKQASRVIISADKEAEEGAADRMTILTILALRGNNKSLPIVAEILSPGQVENAARAGANTIIRTNDFMSILYYHELFKLEHTTPFEDVLHLLSSQQFIHESLPEELVGQSFLQATYSYADSDKILLGLIRHHEQVINPDKRLTMEKEDIMILLSSW